MLTTWFPRIFAIYDFQLTDCSVKHWPKAWGKGSKNHYESTAYTIWRSSSDPIAYAWRKGSRNRRWTGFHNWMTKLFAAMVCDKANWLFAPSAKSCNIYYFFVKILIPQLFAVVFRMTVGFRQCTGGAERITRTIRYRPQIWAFDFKLSWDSNTHKFPCIPITKKSG